jgi:hypothetical protein
MCAWLRPIRPSVGPLGMSLDRSGFLFGSDGGGSEWDLVLIPLLGAVNWAVNLVVFRLGWTVHIIGPTGRTIAKHRYRSRSLALADWDRLASKYGVPQPHEPPA